MFHTIRFKVWIRLSRWLVGKSLPVCYIYAPGPAGDAAVRAVTLATDLNVVRRIYSGSVPFAYTQINPPDQAAISD